MSPRPPPTHEARDPPPAQEIHVHIPPPPPPLPPQTTASTPPTLPPIPTLNTANPPSTAPATPTNPQSRIAYLQSSIARTRQAIAETQTKLDGLCLSVVPEPQPQSQPQTQALTRTHTHDVATSSSDPLRPHNTHNILITTAKRRVKSHIAQLTRYNATKDVAIALLGVIAEREGRGVEDVLRERGVGFAREE